MERSEPLVIELVRTTIGDAAGTDLVDGDIATYKKQNSLEKSSKKSGRLGKEHDLCFPLGPARRMDRQR